MGRKRKGDGITNIPHRFPKLTKNERKELAIKAKNGDIEARDALINSLFGLVNFLARQYKNYQVPLEDLIQEGNLAVIEAIKTFNPKNGADFSTHAFYQIRKAIQTAISNYRSILKVPTPFKKRTTNNQNFSPYWVSGDIVINEEESNKLNGGEKLINIIAIDFRDALEVEQIIGKIDCEKLIQDLKLDEKKAKILELYMLYKYNYAEIGRIVGLSRERIRVIINEINNEIQKKIKTKLPA